MATAPASRTARPRPSNEQLAKQLMDCALLVKRGQKSPLLNQTIHDLMEFMATENGDASPRQQHQHHPKQSSSSNRQEGTVSKPTKPPALAMLGKMVAGVTSSTTDTTTSHRSEASKRATSSKNAARVKADLQQQQQLQQHHGNAGKSTWYAGHHEESEWCEEHFCMGCACKGGKNKPNLPAAAAQRSPNAPPSPTRSTTSSVTTSHTTSLKTKPPFQRPTNPKSSLIANGWIEQQRRSKMRTVWKDVLASLVEGRKPGEETTLWIQRQVTDTSTGKPKLEALHQIPCKWIQDVTLEQYSADNKFTLKVYNLTDEFVFRCPNSEDAAQNWVLTLLSLKELTQQKPGKTTTTTTTKSNEPRNAVDEWENENKVHSRQQQEQRSSFEDEKKSDTSHQAYPQRPAPPTILRDAGSTGSGGGGGRISVHELRAIAHGAGISTVGMERGELEAVVAKLASGAMNNVAQPSAPPVPPPPPPQPDPEEMERRRQEEIARMKQKTMEEKARAQQPFDEETDEIHKEEILKRKAAEEEATARCRAAEEEAARRRAEEEAARRRAEEEAARRRAEEEHRRRIAERVHQQQREAMLRKEEEERKRLEAERLQREEEEHRRRVAEVKAAEERRRQEEMLRQQQQKWQQQQQQWQQQQAEEAKRAAEERRRREEMLRQQQQQWQQQQQHHATRQQHWQQQQHPAPPHQHWQQQHVPPQGFQGHPNHQRFPHPPQQPQPHNAQHPYSPPPPNTGSPINMKYAQMAHQTENQNAMSEQGIKHAVLVEWALQPPMLQVLRPIEVLISSIHTVFPPRFGVQPHEYFSKWKGLSLGDVTLGPSEGNRPDAKKLERAKKKLQLFLHTDKLPKDFSSQQLFLCRLLWDISNDAWNEYKTKEEELGWMR